MSTTAFLKSKQTDPTTFPMMATNFGIPSPAFGSQLGQDNGGIDPTELFSYPFSSQQNLSTSFNYGNSQIDTAELLDLELSRDNSGSNNFVQEQQPTGIALSHQGQMTHIYPQTPDGGQMQSPYIRGSYPDYGHVRQMGGQSRLGVSPQMNSANNPSDSNFLQVKGRSYGGVDHGARSPMSPTTPALGGLNLGTSESSSFPQPIRTANYHPRHQKNMSNQWDNTPMSSHSLAVDSPISSPGNPSHHAISEILTSGKHASLPTRVDPPASLETQEAKRRRRRASHNMVERRRRDNINERIQDLSHLVPQHRLEDDKVRKQLLNNSSLAGTMGGGFSPPNAATSLLAGGNGRRATPGNITLGLPIEDKEKGPNKGDILNGAVGWTRDLMWAMHVKLQQEAELMELVASLGGTWPFEQTEEEKRMRTELLDALERNDPNTFAYSRAPGTGLRVPKHTTLAGDFLPANGTISPQSLSPAFNSDGMSGKGSAQGQYWSGAGQDPLSFKEEDEYATMNMDDA